MIRKDQATNLRILAGEKQGYGTEGNDMNRYYTIVVTSGKGGVGKSFVSLHLAWQLTQADQRVLLVDANLQNPSLHVLTNQDPEYPVNYWLSNANPIEQNALMPLAKNLDLLANSSFEVDSRHYTQDDPNLFLENLKPIAKNYDYVVLDTQTGLNQWNLSLQVNADLSLVVSISDPTSIIDSYTYIKAVLPYIGESGLGLILNQVIDKESGLEAHKNLNLALNHFLNYQVELYSLIPFDMHAKKSGMEQNPMWISSPKNAAMKTIQKMALAIHNANQKINNNPFPQYQEVNV